MANIPLDRTEVEDRIPLGPAESVNDTTNLDGVTDASCVKRLANAS